MSDLNMSERLAQAEARMANLHQRAGYSLLHQQGLLPDAFDELHSTIEELRGAEQELWAQNETILTARAQIDAEHLRYRDLFEFAPDGYLVTDLDGRILEANQAAAFLLSVSPLNLQNRLLSSLVYEEDNNEFRRRFSALQERIALDAPQEWTLRLCRGTLPFCASFTIVPAQRLLLEAPTFRWMLRDVTERRNAEEERVKQVAWEAGRAETEAAHLRITSILETITDTFITLDREWRFTYLNSSAAEMCRAVGKDPEKLLGLVLWEEFPTAIGTAFQTEGLRAAESRRMTEFEEYSNGLGRWLQVRIFPSENGVVAYSQDVTARKEAEIALRVAFEKERRVSGLLENLLLRTAPQNDFPHLSVETFYQAASGESRIGGDFFDVFTLGKGRVALVVGDVSGKGMAAAELTAEIKYVLRAILREAGQPASTMARLNDFICEAQRQGDLGSDHLVVLSLVTIDPETGEAVSLSAGGDPILLLRKGGEVEALDLGGLLLGVHPGAIYTENHFHFQPSDTLVMFTDGLTEARRLGRTALLGYEGLSQLAIRGNSQKTLHGMGQTIMEGAQAWAGGALQDDACLVLARRH